MKKVLIIFFIWFIALQIVNKTSSYLLFNRTNYEAPVNLNNRERTYFLPWLNFDGRNYLAISLSGYVKNDKRQDFLKAFFPVYPLLIQQINKFIPYLNSIIAGLLMSLIFTIANVILLYKLVQGVSGDKKAIRTIILFLLFPTSFFLLAYYTESLFLFLCLITFWFIGKKNLFLASVFTAVATATRITGLTLVPVLLWEAYKHYQKTKKISWSVILSPLGFVGYAIYLHLNFGNWLAMLSKQNQWGRSIGLLGPYYAFENFFSDVFTEFTKPLYGAQTHIIMVLEFITAVFLIWFIVYTRQRIKSSYWLFSLLNVLVIFFGASLTSSPRYILTIFPIFLFLGQNLPNKIYLTCCIVFSLLLIILSSLFLRGYWVA